VNVSQKQPLKTWGYQVWWMPDAWRSLPLAELDRLIFFELKANPQGFINERQGWPEQWLAMRQALAAQGTRFELALSILDTPTFHTLFKDPQAIKQLETQALELAALEGVHGLHLDFEVYETIPPATLQALRLFVQKLSQDLKNLKPARSLSVFYPVGSSSPMYDAPTLATLENVVVQGYDAHWPTAPTAGSVAPLRGPEAVTWEKALAQVLALGMPRERITFSFPLYGYEWPLKPVKGSQLQGRKPGGATNGKANSTTFAPVPAALLPDVQINIRDRVQQYGATQDVLSGSSYYQYKRADGQVFEGWFEDWWALGRKTDFLHAERLSGIAFFPFGYDQNELVEHFLARQRKISVAGEVAAPVVNSAPLPTPSCCQK
jgi:spore germination protein